MFYVDLFRALDREEVRYLLIGGLAINIYGAELASLDDLIALKTDTGRSHDESDIVALRRLRELGAT